MFLKYLILFLSSFLITLIAVPLVKKFGLKNDLVDKPNKRKQHNTPIVRIGGIAIYLGIFIPSFFVVNFNLVDYESRNFLNSLLISSSLLFLLGIYDDVFTLSFAKRLFFQYFIASYLWIHGLQFNTINLNLIYPNLDPIQIPIFLSYLITIFWIVGIINAINWLDGLDGLAAGLSIISSLGLILVATIVGNNNNSFILISLVGSCLAFLIYNFYPAKIFMGDSGSYLIGIILAIYTIYLDKILLDSSIFLISFLPQILILFVPIVDMSYVIFIRLANGNSPFYPDRNHLHHRLIKTGLSHKKTVLTCYGISICFLSIFLFSLK